MTTTPIFDALYREHRNAGMAYPGAADLPSDEQRTRASAPTRTRARRSATVGRNQESSADGEPSADGESDGPQTARCAQHLIGVPSWRPGPSAVEYR